MRTKALKEKRAMFLDMANHFGGGQGVPRDREGAAPHQLGKVRPGRGMRLAPNPGFLTSPPLLLGGEG